MGFLSSRYGLVNTTAHIFVPHILQVNPQLRKTNVVIGDFDAMFGTNVVKLNPNTRYLFIFTKNYD